MNITNSNFKNNRIFRYNKWAEHTSSEGSELSGGMSCVGVPCVGSSTAWGVAGAMVDCLIE